MIIKYPKDVNYKIYSSDKPAETKYGLPTDIRFCKMCVESNQRPSTTIEYKHNRNSKKED